MTEEGNFFIFRFRCLTFFPAKNKLFFRLENLKALSVEKLGSIFSAP
jgi:hypothetical protein